MFPTEWLTGRLVARRPESWPGEVLFIETTPDAAAAHVKPGQYCQLRVDGIAGYFALAGPPGVGPLEFYIQRGGAAADALLRAPLGASIELTLPAGPGYGVDEALAAGGPLYAVCTGAGLASLRSTLERIADHGRTCTVYYGCREPGDFIYLPISFGFSDAAPPCT